MAALRCGLFLLSLFLIMKKSFFILLMFLTVIPGCRKDDTLRTSGTDTIDNTLYGTDITGYYAFGFLFSQAKKVSTLNNTAFDITIGNDGTLSNLIFQTNNYKDSFYKVGEYDAATSAEQAFNNLTSYTVPQWVIWGYQIKPNQVWLFRTASERYAKLRIISTISENRNNRYYAECTFQWMYQPDGSLTFPGK
jgi:hypothetical protein